MARIYINISLLIILLSGCAKQDRITPTTGSDNENWLIPAEEVLYRDKPRDRIQSIDAPEFIPLSASQYDDNDIVLVTQYNNETRVYALSVMNGHEIVNDSIEDYFFAVTYCPLTESALVWDRTIHGDITQFGVSGMLYNDNLMPYDRNTQSVWSQMLTHCVQGELAGDTPITGKVIKTKFSTVKEAFPDANVLFHTSCDSNSCVIEKQGTEINNDPGDGESGIDLPDQEDFYGISINNQLLLFNLKEFSDKPQLLFVSFIGNNLIVYADPARHIYTSFIDPGTSANNTYEVTTGQLPIIMKDTGGNRYDIFGNTTDGPDAGKQLAMPLSYTARTFAWDSFFSQITIYQ